MCVCVRTMAAENHQSFQDLFADAKNTSFIERRKEGRSKDHVWDRHRGRCQEAVPVNVNLERERLTVTTSLSSRAGGMPQKNKTNEPRANSRAGMATQFGTTASSRQVFRDRKGEVVRQVKWIS